MSILAPDTPEDMDLNWIGLLDAKMSGWFLKDSGELFKGFKISASDSVLDVGCGDGTAALFCTDRGAHVTISDIDADTIKALETKLDESGANGRYSSVVCNSDPLLVPDSFATRVICQEVLEHVENPQRVVSELVRAGKPGALYLLTVPGQRGEEIQKKFAPADYFEHPHHIRIFEKGEFNSLAENAGLEVIEYSSNGFYLTFWMCIQWAVAAANSRNSGEPYSFSDSPFVPPFDESLSGWARLWGSLISTPEGEALKKEMDKLLPKVQIIIARKPG